MQQIKYALHVLQDIISTVAPAFLSALRMHQIAQEYVWILVLLW